MTRYLPLSPDGFPLTHTATAYATRAGARRALTQWAKRYEHQGYYRTSRWERIELPDLLDNCYITEQL